MLNRTLVSLFLFSFLASALAGCSAPEEDPIVTVPEEPGFEHEVLRVVERITVEEAIIVARITESNVTLEYELDYPHNGIRYTGQGGTGAIAHSSYCFTYLWNAHDPILAVNGVAVDDPVPFMINWAGCLRGPLRDLPKGEIVVFFAWGEGFRRSVQAEDGSMFEVLYEIPNGVLWTRPSDGSWEMDEYTQVGRYFRYAGSVTIPTQGHVIADALFSGDEWNVRMQVGNDSYHWKGYHDWENVEREGHTPLSDVRGQGDIDVSIYLNATRAIYDNFDLVVLDLPFDPWPESVPYQAGPFEDYPHGDCHSTGTIAPRPIGPGEQLPHHC
jgi:hypothetical protein